MRDRWYELNPLRPNALVNLRVKSYAYDQTAEVAEVGEDVICGS